MSEVGQRAMSASINDPATAISVLNALTRVIIDTQALETEVLEFEHLSIVDMDEASWVESAFAPIARDSVANLEINQRLGLLQFKRSLPHRQLRNYGGYTPAALNSSLPHRQLRKKE